MTSYAQFNDAMEALSPAEAFYASARIEEVASKVPAARSVADLLLNVATRFEGSGEQLAEAVVDRSKIALAVDMVTKSTVLEVSEFVMLMRQQPRYIVS